MRTTVLATERPMPKTSPAVHGPPEDVRDSHPEGGGDEALRDRAGDRDAPDGDELFDVKLQSDAEHQEDDADFGELLGHVPIGDESRRVRADEQAGDQIADDGGEPGALRGEAEDERRRRGRRQVRIRSRMHSRSD